MDVIRRYSDLKKTYLYSLALRNFLVDEIATFYGLKSNLKIFWIKKSLLRHLSNIKQKSMLMCIRQITTILKNN
jgi:hypothetical protein